MVLKPRGSAGVTLIELLVSISLSVLVIGMALALFKDVGSVARLGQGRAEASMEAQAAFTALSNNLMTGGGLLNLGPGSLELLNLRNRRMKYRWEESTLTLNDRAMKFRLASLEAAPEGPMRPDWKDFGGTVHWDLDSLDGNRDGAIDFEELDRDRSGELEPEECRYIARVRLTMTTVHQGIPTTQTCTVHPRNRVPAVSGQDAEEVMESGGIPEP
jgi:hypothetical protein